MKKIYINSKKKRLMERNSYTLRLSIQDTKGKKTAVSVLVKKLVPNDVGTFHTRIPTVAVKKSKSYKRMRFGTGVKVQTGTKNESNTQKNCYRVCTYRERLKRKRLQCWDIIDPQLTVFSLDELIGNNIIVKNAGKKIGGIVVMAKIIDTPPINRPAPPIEKNNILKEENKKR